MFLCNINNDVSCSTRTTFYIQNIDIILNMRINKDNSKSNSCELQYVLQQIVLIEYYIKYL